MDIPVVRQHDQRRPSFTGDEVTKIVAAAQGKYQVLFPLLAGTGMRIGEALALDVRHLKRAH
jgi:integrase